LRVVVLQQLPPAPAREVDAVPPLAPALPPLPAARSDVVVRP
jgi:hypothetical protein